MFSIERAAFGDAGVLRVRSAGVRPSRPGLIAAVICTAAMHSPGANAATVIQGTSANDVIDVSAAAVSYEIYGLAGADTLRGSRVADLLDGGGGADRIEGNDGADDIVGAGGNDTLIGGNGDDRFRVSGSGTGFDMFDGGTGYDSIRGGTADDTIGARGISSIEFIDGGAGRDTLKLQDGAGVTLNLSNVTLNGIEMISGGSGADLIVGSSHDDVLRGGGGNDQLRGGPGVDRVVYGGPASAYQVSFDGSTFTVRAMSGTDGTDTLVAVEFVEFVDGCYQQAVFNPDCAAVGSDALLPLLQAAPEGAWIKANLNEFHEAWTPVDRRPATGSYINPARVLFAWSSMAWDPNRAHLIFWGGGHANYSGNEVYRFDVRARRWHRASLPSDVYAPLGDSQYFAVDGPFNAPIAAHTYDNQEFLPAIDRFITFGGGKFNGGNRFVLLDGTTATGPYLWDPSRAGADMVGGTAGSQVKPATYANVLGGRMWQNRNSVVQQGIGATRPTVFWNGTTAYAPLQGKDSLFVSETPSNGGRLFRYTISDPAKPALDTWQLIGIIGAPGYSGQGAGAYDPVRGLFARTAETPAGPALVVWNVNLPGPGNRSYNVMPQAVDGTFSVSRMQGMDYDPVRKAFVLWDGGPDVWYVRPAAVPSSGVWTAWRGARVGASAPQQSDGILFASGGSAKQPNGILGKWKYGAAYDVFFGVEDPVKGDVWVYKPENWTPQISVNQ